MLGSLQGPHAEQPRGDPRVAGEGAGMHCGQKWRTDQKLFVGQAYKGESVACLAPWLLLGFEACAEAGGLSLQL